MSFYCKKPNHSNYNLTMVCVDKNCESNEIICHYCLFENHKGHVALPVEMFVQNFREIFSKNPEIIKLKQKLECLASIKEKYLQKIYDFEKAVLEILENLKRKINNLFEIQSDFQILKEANEVLQVNQEFTQSNLNNFSEFESMVNSCLRLARAQTEKETEIKEHLNFQPHDLKFLNNAIDLSLTRITSFESKITKSMQKNLKSLETDFSSILGQLSIDDIRSIRDVPEPDKAILEGHRNYIRRIVSLGNWTHSPLIASCSQDGQIRVWNYVKNICVAVLSGHKGQIYDLIFLEKQKFLISASQDHTIKIWKVGSWKCLKTLYGNEGWVGHLVFNQNTNILSSGGSDRKVRLWEIESGTCKKIFAGTESEIFSLENGFWEKQLRVIAGDIRGKIYFFNCFGNSTFPEKKINAHTDKILKLKFYKSKEKKKKILISCSNDKTIKVWNAKSMDLLKNLEIHTNFVTDFFFDETKEILISCSFDSSIKMVSLKNYEVLATWKINQHLINILWVPISNILFYSSTTNNEFGIYLYYF